VGGSHHATRRARVAALPLQAIPVLPHQVGQVLSDIRAKVNVAYVVLAVTALVGVLVYWFRPVLGSED
jgi:hypothetical protein